MLTSPESGAPFEYLEDTSATSRKIFRDRQSENVTKKQVNPQKVLPVFGALKTKISNILVFPEIKNDREVI